MLDFSAVGRLLLVLDGFLILLRHDGVPSNMVTVRKVQMLVGYRIQSVISSDHMNQPRRRLFHGMHDLGCLCSNMLRKLLDTSP